MYLKDNVWSNLYIKENFQCVHQMACKCMKDPATVCTIIEHLNTSRILEPITFGS